MKWFRDRTGEEASGCLAEEIGGDLVCYLGVRNMNHLVFYCEKARPPTIELLWYLFARASWSALNLTREAEFASAAAYVLVKTRRTVDPCSVLAIAIENDNIQLAMATRKEIDAEKHHEILWSNAVVASRMYHRNKMTKKLIRWMHRRQ